MSEQQSQQQQQPQSQEPQVGLNSGRRKLVRAGLAAAPVVAAFKSNMVLASSGGGGAGTTVRASSFASFGANGANCSAAPGRSTGRYLPLDQCKTDPRSDKLMFGAYKKPNQGCDFGRGPDASIGNKTLKQVFVQASPNQTQKLAQYVAAGYLASLEFGSDSFISGATCKQIWSDSGVWSPAPGITWSMRETFDYFDRVYGNAGFSACLTDPT